MKAVNYLTLGIVLLTSTFAAAQSAINPDLNLDANTILKNEMATDIRYYYYPNLQAYFDTKTLTYLYSKNKEWVESSRIPSGYMGYSVYNNNKVAITDYLGDTPYEMIDEHRKQYPPQYITKRQPPKAAKADESALAFN